MANPFLHYDGTDRLRWASPLEFVVDLLRWLLIVVLCMAVLALLHAWHADRPGHRSQQLREGWLQVGDSALAPLPTAGDWKAVELPHDWRALGLREVRQIWYRFDLKLERAPDELFAVYLPSVGMNAEVYVNELLVGSGGAFEPDVARNWNRPLLFTLPGSILRSGDNTVLVRVAGVPAGTGQLAPLYVGAADDLRGDYGARRFLKVTVPTVASLATALLALATLLIHWSRPELPVYRWFGIGTLIWSLHNLNLVVTDPLLPAAVWDWLWYVSLGWFIVMIPPYVHGLLGYERPAVERALFAYAAAGSIALAGLAAWDHALMDRVARHVWVTSALAIGVYPTLMMLLAVWRSRDVEIQWLLTTGLLMFVLGARDALAMNDLIARTEGYMIAYSAPAVIGVFGWLLLSRFLRSVGEVEALNRDLHERVEQRTAELKASFAQLTQMDRDRAIQSERERILRDMHDGVGGSLVAAIAVAESGSVAPADMAASLRDTLDELRVTIDALDLERGDADGALCTLRARLRPLLERESPRLHWDCETLPPMPLLGPERLSDLVRIVREAVANALRHARAGNIWVRARREQGTRGARVRIEIEDDGVGIGRVERHGHGLANMRRRAESLDAGFEIVSLPSGTRITLLLALERSAAER